MGGDLSGGLFGTRRPPRTDRPDRDGDRRPPRREQSAGFPSRGSGRSDDRPAGRGAGSRARDAEDARPPREVQTGSRVREEDVDERWPDLPAELDLADLDPEVRRDLRGLSAEGSQFVGGHLLAAVELAEDEPELAWHHARAARSRGGRIAVVRETVGLVAYRAGHWSEALAELRAARRMAGGPGHLAVMADCERALGNPEKSIELSRSAEAEQLDPDAQLELRIVVAAARADLGQLDAALVHLEAAGARADSDDAAPARLLYAYADLLEQAGRRDEAIAGFLRAANADDEDETDAEERLALLTQDEVTPADDAHADVPAGAADDDAARDRSDTAPDEVDAPADAATAQAESDAASGPPSDSGDDVEPSPGAATTAAASDLEATDAGSAGSADAGSAGGADQDGEQVVDQQVDVSDRSTQPPSQDTDGQALDPAPTADDTPRTPDPVAADGGSGEHQDAGQAEEARPDELAPADAETATADDAAPVRPAPDPAQPAPATPPAAPGAVTASLFSHSGYSPPAVPTGPADTDPPAPASDRDEDRR